MENGPLYVPTLVMCQIWGHLECFREVEKEIVQLWCCQSCRQMATPVEKILQKVTAVESCVTMFQESNQQLIALVQEQHQELRSLREDALKLMSTQQSPRNTLQRVSNIQLLTNYRTFLYLNSYGDANLQVMGYW